MVSRYPDLPVSWSPVITIWIWYRNSAKILLWSILHSTKQTLSRQTKRMTQFTTQMFSSSKFPASWMNATPGTVNLDPRNSPHLVWIPHLHIHHPDITNCSCPSLSRFPGLHGQPPPPPHPPIHTDTHTHTTHHLKLSHLMKSCSDFLPHLGSLQTISNTSPTLFT